ncbi:MAG: ParB N-terminal domain-containing protein [Pseudomonadota bacterium]|nr:ParB N-terminal domain-containing protein [Pseudomonadota bacterium]
MKNDLTLIRLDQIDGLEDRIRVIDPAWVKLLAEEINESGLKDPVRVREEDGRFRLIDGARRIAAYKQLGREEIEASTDNSDEALKIAEIKAHMLRADLTALEHATCVATWCDIYREAQGPQKRGRKPSAPASDGELEEMSAKLALNWSEAAQQALGIGRRSVFRSLKIASIDADLRKKVALHPVANVQRELLVLAEQSASMQAAIIDMLIDEPAKAQTVSDALILLGATPAAKSEPVYARLSERFSRLPEKEQFAFFNLHESVIDLWLAQRATGSKKAA